MAENAELSPLRSRLWSCASLQDAVQVMLETNNPTTLRALAEDLAWYDMA